jgi:hypothetical protein
MPIQGTAMDLMPQSDYDPAPARITGTAMNLLPKSIYDLDVKDDDMQKNVD